MTEDRLIFTSRRWWREPKAVVLALTVVGLTLLFVWPSKREQPKSCISIYRQGNVTTQATGTLLRDARGRIVCEVVR